MSSFHIKTISPETFQEVLARYPAVVPEKLRNLDAQRYDVIPRASMNRLPGDMSLTKAEVEKLVEWKLKHGTFRPALLGLVQSNTSQAIEETTKKAYDTYLHRDVRHPKPDIIDALKVLVGLKGIGPATASLLLSAQTTDVPFFSDELFRWCCWDHEVKDKDGAGWKRKIKYNFKEYEAMLDEVEKLVMRFQGSGPELGLSVKASDVEKVAWVLGKEGRDVGVGEDEEKQSNEAGEAPVKGEESKEMKSEKAEGDHGKATQLPAKKGTKRKAAPTKAPVEGTRKSTRTKK